MDNLDDLPVDNKMNDARELDALKTYYKLDQPSSGSKRSLAEFKEVVFATLLFILMSLPLTDKIINLIPFTDSTYAFYGIKAFLFFCILYIIIIMFS